MPLKITLDWKLHDHIGKYWLVYLRTKTTIFWNGCETHQRSLITIVSQENKGTKNLNLFFLRWILKRCDCCWSHLTCWRIDFCPATFIVRLAQLIRDGFWITSLVLWWINCIHQLLSSGTLIAREFRLYMDFDILTGPLRKNIKVHIQPEFSG